jgi:hypothetical protein
MPGGRIRLGVADYGTIAYDAATGRRRGAPATQRRQRPGPRHLISPSDVVYVTAGVCRRPATTTPPSPTTATGKPGVARHNGAPARTSSLTIAVSRTASRYITGGSHGKTSRIDFATVGHNAATGKQLWAGRYNGPANLNDSGAGIAVSPDNATVVVTGGSKGKAGQYDPDWATIAYNAKTGAGRWTKRYGRASTADISTAVIIDPGAGTVYVTGLVGGFKEDGEYGTWPTRSAPARRSGRVLRRSGNLFSKLRHGHQPGLAHPVRPAPATAATPST